MSRGPSTLDRIFEERTSQLADKAALVFRGTPTSFSALYARAAEVAAALARDGLGPGTRLATLDKNHAAHFELLFGAAKSGAVLVPISFRLSALEIEYILNDARPAILFVGPELEALVEGIRPRLKHPLRLIVLNQEGSDGYSGWRRTGGAEPAAAGHASAPHGTGDADSPLLQMYTSGTTGHPKGVLLSHRNLLGLLERSSQHMGTWHSDDVSLQAMPLFHIGGTAWGLISLYCGATVHLLRDADPGVILKEIETQRVTKVFLVPALILFLLQHPRFAHTDLSTLRHILYGASPITESLLSETLQRFPCELGQVYGLTETCGTIAYLDGAAHKSGSSQRIRSCGRPLPGIDIRVVDATGQPLPAGAIGEVVCRSEQNMQGYYNYPQLTADVIKGDWLYTGDAGYFDEDGYLYIHDRVKDLIISGGENIYPAEVESALTAHPAVADAAVIGIPDDRWGESVLAFVVCKPGNTVTEPELLSAARTRLAGYKVPRAIQLVSSLPRNASGKLLKRELRRPYWEGQARQVH